MTDRPHYYHGTWDGYGYDIMIRGFELGHEGLGNMTGRGVYIAQKPRGAGLWARFLVIVCRLQPGTRILWVDDEYDQRVIDSLRRKYGQELLDLGPNFGRVLPPNKHLTNKELIHLCSYVRMQTRKQGWKRGLRPSKAQTARYLDGWRRIVPLHTQLRKHGYRALGDRSRLFWDSDEIVVYNPARVQPLSAHRFKWVDDVGDDYELSSALSFEELRLIAKKARI